MQNREIASKLIRALKADREETKNKKKIDEINELISCIRHENLECPDQNANYDTFCSLFFEAQPLYCNCKNFFNALLDYKLVDINQRGLGHRTCLWNAVCDGNEIMVDFLIKLGADVEIPDGDFTTRVEGYDHGYANRPLHQAIFQKNLRIVQMLVDAGAKLNSLNGIGQTPLEVCSGEDFKKKVIGIFKKKQKQMESEQKQIDPRYKSNIFPKYLMGQNKEYREYHRYFETIYDEPIPTIFGGRGVHYSILYARDLKHCFAVIWDEDHDERVIEIIVGLYENKKLDQFIIFGERKGGFTAIANPVKEYVEIDSNDMWPNKDFFDPWHYQTIQLENVGYSSIIQSSNENIAQYIKSITNNWNLGYVPIEKLSSYGYNNISILDTRKKVKYSEEKKGTRDKERKANTIQPDKSINLLDFVETFIFDFDETLMDTSAIQKYRKRGRWKEISKKENLNKCRVYDGIEELLKNLKENKKRIAIVTSSPRDVCVLILNHHNLLDYFDCVVGYHDTEKKKPEPDPILHAMDKLNIKNTKEVIYIGDNANDIIAGKRAKCLTMAVAWGETPLEELAVLKPTYIAENVESILTPKESETVVNIPKAITAIVTVNFFKDQELNTLVNERININGASVGLTCMLYLGHYFPCSAGRKDTKPFFEKDWFSKTLIGLKGKMLKDEERKKVKWKHRSDKYQHVNALKFFIELLLKLVAKNNETVIAVIPSSTVKNTLHGITKFAFNLAKNSNNMDGTAYLRRTETIKSASSGGLRDSQQHQKTLRIEDEKLVKGKDVLLFDDVMTSGSSFRVARDKFLNAGARTVCFFSLGKTVPNLDYMDPEPPTKPQKCLAKLSQSLDVSLSRKGEYPKKPNSVSLTEILSKNRTNCLEYVNPNP